jgi:hypothetical protein
MFDGSNDPALVVSHLTTCNGTHYVVSLAVTSFSAATVYYRVDAADNSGNAGQAPLQDVNVIRPFDLGSHSFYIAAGVGAVATVGILIYSVRRPGRLGNEVTESDEAGCAIIVLLPSFSLLRRRYDERMNSPPDGHVHER